MFCIPYRPCTQSGPEGTQRNGHPPHPLLCRRQDDTSMSSSGIEGTDFRTRKSLQSETRSRHSSASPLPPLSRQTVQRKTITFIHKTGNTRYTFLYQRNSCAHRPRLPSGASASRFLYPTTLALLHLRRKTPLPQNLGQMYQTFRGIRVALGAANFKGAQKPSKTMHRCDRFLPDSAETLSPPSFLPFHPNHSAARASLPTEKQGVRR